MTDQTDIVELLRGRAIVGDALLREAAMGEQLLPCPWCGNSIHSAVVVEGDTFRWRKIRGCCTDGPEVRHNTLAEDQQAAEEASRTAAIAAWNRRADAQGDRRDAEPMPPDRYTNSPHSAMRVLVDIRFAIGDNGRRMQDELVEHCRELARDAARYRTVRDLVLRDPCAPMTGTERVLYRLFRIDSAKPGTWDAAIDAVMAEKEVR